MTFGLLGHIIHELISCLLLSSQSQHSGHWKSTAELQPLVLISCSRSVNLPLILLVLCYIASVCVRLCVTARCLWANQRIYSTWKFKPPAKRRQNPTEGKVTEVTKRLDAAVGPRSKIHWRCGSFQDQRDSSQGRCSRGRTH